MQTRQGIALFKTSLLSTNLIYKFLSFRKKNYNLKNNLLFISHTLNTHTYALLGFFEESSMTRIMKQKQNGKEMKITDADIRLLVCLSC